MDPLFIVVLLALVATVITLALGLLSMSGGESVDEDFEYAIDVDPRRFAGIRRSLTVPRAVLALMSCAGAAKPARHRGPRSYRRRVHPPCDSTR